MLKVIFFYPNFLKVSTKNGYFCGISIIFETCFYILKKIYRLAKYDLLFHLVSSYIPRNNLASPREEGESGSSFNKESFLPIPMKKKYIIPQDVFLNFPRWVIYIYHLILIKLCTRNFEPNYNLINMRGGGRIEKRL